MADNPAKLTRLRQEKKTLLASISRLKGKPGHVNTIASYEARIKAIDAELPKPAPAVNLGDK